MDSITGSESCEAISSIVERNSLVERPFPDTTQPDRGAHVEGAAKPFIVPPPHAFQGRELNLLNGPSGALPPDQFGLVEVVESLGHGIFDCIEIF